MKVRLNETKEKIPAEFITSFISKGWEEIGALKAEIASIGKEFTGTKAIEETLQDLLDAYLVAVGRFQGYLENKNMVVLPDDMTKNESLHEELDEDANITIDKVDINVGEPKIELPETNDFDILAGEFEDEEPVQVFAPAKKPAVVKPVIQSVEPVATSEADGFDYFCDFEEPDLSEQPLTDADIYPNQQM